MRSDDAVVGLISPGEITWIPYSVSMPQTFVIATLGRYPTLSRGPVHRGGGSEILARADPFDGTSATLLAA
jgi:hypothetical protein